MWSHKLLSVLRTGLLDLHTVSHHLRQNIIAETPRHVTPRVMTPRSPSQSRLLSSDCGDVPPSSLLPRHTLEEFQQLQPVWPGRAGREGGLGSSSLISPSTPPVFTTGTRHSHTGLSCLGLAWPGQLGVYSCFSFFFYKKCLHFLAWAVQCGACLWFFGFASRN